MTETRARYGSILACPLCGSYPAGHSAEQCVRMLAMQRDAWQAAYEALLMALVLRMERILKQEECSD